VRLNLTFAWVRRCFETASHYSRKRQGRLICIKPSGDQWVLRNALRRSEGGRGYGEKCESEEPDQRGSGLDKLISFFHKGRKCRERGALEKDSLRGERGGSIGRGGL